MSNTPKTAAKRKVKVRPVENWAGKAQHLAQHVKLTTPPEIELLEYALQAVGAEIMEQLAQEAMEDEKRGGLAALDGAHLLRAGDILLYRAYTRLPPKKRKQVMTPKGHRPPPAPPEPTPEPPPPAQIEDEVVSLPPPAPVAAKRTQAKLILTGRPVKVERRGEYVALFFETGPLPDLPKSYPVSPAQTAYIAYVTVKHWAEVTAALKAADDNLIVEGYGAYDAVSGQSLLFALRVTTKALQRAKYAKEGK